MRRQFYNFKEFIAYYEYNNIGKTLFISRLFIYYIFYRKNIYKEKSNKECLFSFQLDIIS